eukprot:scaffold102106_cov31-Prasinocladus_malaysianus.AAC.1
MYVGHTLRLHQQITHLHLVWVVCPQGPGGVGDAVLPGPPDRPHPPLGLLRVVRAEVVGLAAAGDAEHAPGLAGRGGELAAVHHGHPQVGAKALGGRPHGDPEA